MCHLKVVQWSPHDLGSGLECHCGLLTLISCCTHVGLNIASALDCLPDDQPCCVTGAACAASAAVCGVSGWVEPLAGLHIALLGRRLQRLQTGQQRLSLLDRGQILLSVRL